MTRVFERQAQLASTRTLPINARLYALLDAAAAAVDVDVVVTSGGQGAKGSGKPRIGSTRHDNGNAADLELHREGKALSFELDRPVFAAFVTACAARGAIGIGAGIGYMGDKRIHVGFGETPVDTRKLTWGAGGHGLNAPPWLKAAAKAGWDAPVTAPVARRTLVKGDHGPDVQALQTALWKVGGYGLLIDSDFGPKTEAAVVAFQSARGLNPDGVVGAKTWAALEG
jgi:hypothetical protein